MLLENKQVVILNAEKAVFLGEFKKVLQKWKDWMEIRTLTNPRKGPFHHVRPDLFLKRRIRGMLPSYWKHKRSRVVFKRLKVYMGIPRKYSNVKPIRLQDAVIDPSSGKYKFVYLEDLCKELGWHPRYRA